MGVEGLPTVIFFNEGATCWHFAVILFGMSTNFRLIFVASHFVGGTHLDSCVSCGLGPF